MCGLCFSRSLVYIFISFYIRFYSGAFVLTRQTGRRTCQNCSKSDDFMGWKIKKSKKIKITNFILIFLVHISHFIPLLLLPLWINIVTVQLFSTQQLTIKKIKKNFTILKKENREKIIFYINVPIYPFYSYD